VLLRAAAAASKGRAILREWNVMILDHRSTVSWVWHTTRLSLRKKRNLYDVRFHNIILSLDYVKR
jgi:hypothetical protein